MRRQRVGDKWDDLLTILGGLLLAGMLAIFLFGCNSKTENQLSREYIDIQWGHFGPALSCGWGLEK